MVSEHVDAEASDVATGLAVEVARGRRTVPIDHHWDLLSEEKLPTVAISVRSVRKRLLLRFTFEGRLAILGITAAMDRRR